MWIYNPHPEFSAAEVLGKTDLELGDHPGARALYRLKLRVLHTRKARAEELEFPGEGADRIFEFTASPLFEDGALVGVSTVGLDVTARRAASEARAKQREEQLRLISHDLRQPLNVIGVAASSLASAAGSGSPIGALGERIQSNVRSMSRALEDILELGEWEAGEFALHREPTALGPFLQETLQAGVAPDKLSRVELEVGSPEAVELDPIKVGRAVLNLVDNALKFSPADTPVRVRVARRSGKIRISVTDQGPGLDSGAAETVFEKYRSSSRSRACGGKGLGLYSARLIVEAHGGECQVDSAPGRGATFWIELPAHSN